MSPDEQKQFIARMKERGAGHQRVRSARRSAAAKAAAKAPSARRSADAAGARRSTRCSRRCRSSKRAGARGSSTNKQLKPVNLRLGITDGTQTEAAQRRAAAGHGSRHRRDRRQRPPDAAAGGNDSGNPLLPQPAAADRAASGGGGRGRGRRCRRVPVISVKNLVKTYVVGEVEVKALRGVNLDVQRGEFLAVTGPSGSGKSTFMHIVGASTSRRRASTSSTARTCRGCRRTQLAAVRNKKIGFVFQGFNLLSRTSALDNVELPLLYGGSALKTAERHKRAMEVLTAVGLGNRADHHPESAVGRPAAARRDRARADQQPVDPAGGRADREPRHADQHRSDGHLPAAEQGARHHGRADHARARTSRSTARASSSSATARWSPIAR